MFVKGKPKTGGRKKGVTNKHTRNYLDLQLWFERVNTDLDLLEDPERRIDIELKVIDKVLAKMQNLPSTPGDSLSNAIRAQERLKALEEGSREPIENPGGAGDVTINS